MFDALAHRFDDGMARARAQTAVVQRAVDELAAVAGMARSAHGEVEAVVDARGALVSLRLAASLMKLPAAEVGKLIVATAHTAAADARRRRRRVLADLALDLGGYSVPHGC